VNSLYAVARSAGYKGLLIVTGVYAPGLMLSRAPRTLEFQTGPAAEYLLRLQIILPSAADSNSASCITVWRP